MSVYNWSTTAGTNATADSSINWAEGQAPSSINDSARSMMAALAKYNADISGAITTAGTSTAYTVTSNSVFDTLAHMHQQMIAFVPHTTSGATVTLNVDGLGAKPLRSAPSVELPSGTLVQGTPYVATYNNSDAAFYLQGFIGNPYQIPIGGMMPYLGSTAPNSAFVLPYGQAISRTVYSSLFSLVGTTFGNGDGSNTYNVIDMRGRLPIGLDNMGGSAAGRVSSTMSGTVVGATGGAETVTLQTANLPAYTPAGIISVSDTRVWQSVLTSGATGGGSTGVQSNSNSGTLVGQIQVGSGSITASFTGSAQGGTSTAVNKMPPAIIVPYILRVI